MLSGDNGVVGGLGSITHSPLTLSSIALPPSGARTTNRFDETNFSDFLLFGCGDNNEDDRFHLADLGVLGNSRLDFCSS